jgi:hypothetical protein
MTIVTVIVKRLADAGEPHPEDAEVAPEGFYRYEVADGDALAARENPAEGAREVALDEFHDSIPIRMLDHFEVTADPVDTDEEFRAHEGRKCPICGSDEVTPWGSISVKGTVMTQTMGCNCGAEWSAKFVLQGYDDLTQYRND